MKMLFLIRGCPGAGKSTLVKSLKVFAVSADDYHTDADGNYTWTPEKSKAGHKWCQQEVKNAMESCFIDNIAVHNTFTQEWEMQPYFDLAEEFGYCVTTLIVENRHNSKSVHNVPVKTIKKMADRFEIKLAPDVSYDDFVTKKEQNGLIIHKYKRKVFHDNLWHLHSGLVDARGMVTDSDNNLVQYPFTKIFNYRENNTVIDPTHEVLAIDKINGFMACVTWYKGEPLVSTTGSLSSDFVAMAKEFLPLNKMTKILSLYSHCSFCFEIVHPNDPHIITEKFGAYLIGAREKVLGSKQMNQKTLDEFAKYWDVMRPEYRTCLFSELLEFQTNYQREGFVVYDKESENVLKIKTPYYLTAKFIARTKKLEFIFDKNYKEKFDEEYYSLCEYLQEKYTKEEFLNIHEQDRLEIVRNWAQNTLN